MATRNAYEIPSSTQLTSPNGSGQVESGWLQWMQRTHNGAATLQQSGITADRPVTLLWIGRFYFDTTIGKPIWLKSVNPNVWVDGAGTVS